MFGRVINRVGKTTDFGHRVRVLGSGPHTPTRYPPGEGSMVDGMIEFFLRWLPALAQGYGKQLSSSYS